MDSGAPAAGPDTTPSRPVDDGTSRPVGGSSGPAASPGAGGQRNASCIICLEDVSGYPIFLPCAHGPFHHHCLIRTLAATNQQCPICRHRSGRAWKKELVSICNFLLNVSGQEFPKVCVYFAELWHKIFNQWTRTHCATTAWPGDVLGAAAAVHHREPVQVIPDQGEADEPERPAPPEREPHGDAPAPDHDL